MRIDSKRHEAQDWLQNNPNKYALAGNRFGTTEKVLKFVEQLYTAGALKYT